jgi:hypothetical protein
MDLAKARKYGLKMDKKPVNSGKIAVHKMQGFRHPINGTKWHI